MPLCRVMVVYKYLYIARKSGHGEKRVAHRPNHTIFTADPRKNIRRERAPEPRSGPADEWKFSSPPLSRPLEVPNERNNATPSALVASRWAKNNPEASEKRTLFIYTAPNRFAVTELQNNIGRRESLENTTNPTDMTKIIQVKTNELKLRGINITFIWVPGHTNITRNEIADKAANEAAQPNNNI
ncbi:RNase H domain-containing protein [Aphis craccivora]|uniref:RNase H domain-containing protein n=1 Tax=Aphis craccivora TaxID=307492 RepID=A0A6G0YN43_APHCR|nr:RNase H domain-containing protein [Aphis craccivora]